MKKLIIMCHNNMKTYVFDFDNDTYCPPGEDLEDGIIEFLDRLNSLHITEVPLKMSEISWMLSDEFVLEIPTLN